ncbi:MAG: transglutaminase domain-containing protein [Ignavibacteriae bacterium]|nr:transglutaminase domain-containing protein [Ignavibacteriota bacterium]
MLSANNIYAQQSLDSFGSIGNVKNSNFRLNSLESNASNYNNSKEWELNISTKSILGQSGNVNFNALALSKRFDKHYLYVRISPGLHQEFEFISQEFVIGDTLQAYKTNLNYNEKYGFGYAYNFSKDFTAGFSLRYFQQTFLEEFPKYFSSSDSTVIQVQEEEIDKNFWRGDIGLSYIPYKNLRLSLASTNLFITKEYVNDNSDSEFEIKSNTFDLKQNKGAIFGINYSPIKQINLDVKYETNNSFVIGSNFGFNVYNSFVSFGISAFHEKYQEPFISGVQPVINYSSDLFSVTLSYLKYIGNRNSFRTLNNFRENGIRNISSNSYSSDNIKINLNFALSFKNQALVEILDVKILDEIYPTQSENYIDRPFAIGKIMNLTDEKVSVKPSSFINELNSEIIYSPIISVEPFDTIDIPFFTIISNEKNIIEKRKIAQSNFYVSTISDEPDDEIKKPILINDRNSWDGNVNNLRHFVKSDIDFSHNFAKKILKENEDSSSETNLTIVQFNNIKTLYNKIVKNMSYVSDRRATSDYVQFPRETLNIKGGDCDDLSVCFSSILESVGIQTAFIDYKPNGSIGHVCLLVNTSLVPSQAELITINDRKYFTRINVTGEEEIWLPIELTIFTSFEDAWNSASTRFYKEAIDEYGLSKTNVEIVDVY